MNHCKYQHIQRPDKIKSNEARNANSQTHRQIVNKPPGQPDLFGREMKANGKTLTQAVCFKTSITVSHGCKARTGSQPPKHIHELYESFPSGHIRKKNVFSFSLSHLILCFAACCKFPLASLPELTSPSHRLHTWLLPCQALFKFQQYYIGVV